MLISQPARTDFQDNKVNYVFGNFGVIHYNKPMTFSVLSLDQLCDIEGLKDITTPTYVVVPDGPCSFVQAALNAQKLGAQGIIFASFATQYAQGNVVREDDGTGRRVKIAVLFISIEDGKKLASLSNVQIKVSFDLARAPTAAMDLFLSATGRQNYIYLRNLRPLFKKISSSVKLDVIYYSFECQSCSAKECLLGNEFCTFDMENYASDLGTYILEEQLRQYKVFLYAQKTNKIDIWFEYMDQFDKNCD